MLGCARLVFQMFVKKHYRACGCRVLRSSFVGQTLDVFARPASTGRSRSLLEQWPIDDRSTMSRTPARRHLWIAVGLAAVLTTPQALGPGAATASEAVAATASATPSTARNEGASAGGVTFPGPRPGPSHGEVTGTPGSRQVVLSNRAISAHWQVHGSRVNLVGLRNKLTGQKVPISSRHLLSLTLADGTTISEADLTVTAPTRLVPVQADPGAARVAERSRGKSAVTQLRYQDGERVLDIRWTVLLRNDANNVQQSVTLRAERGTFPIRSLRLLDLDVGDARVVGKDDGSPVVVGDSGQESAFLGVENPMAQARSDGAHTTIDVPRATNLGEGESSTYTSSIGVVADGQLRRSFLYYVERERAHERRPFLHYQSWFDLKPPGLVIKASQLREAINLFGSELTSRGAKIDSFWIDDGWDYLRAPTVANDAALPVWSFDPTQFPDGFAREKQAAAQYGGASLSVWMSPFGGYGESAARRQELNASKPPARQLETHPTGQFKLSGEKYYERFRSVVFDMLDHQGVRGFKFDGIGGGLYQSGPNRAYLQDYEALLKLMTQMRQHEPDVWINATVGTWGSPYWLWYADSIYRDGNDASQAGLGSPTQRYVNYRDSQTYRNFATENPLFPIPSLMTHGFIFSDRAPQFDADHDLSKKSVRAEVSADMRAYFAEGLGLQELYVRHTLVSPDKTGSNWFWDNLAANAKWSRANLDLLSDTHWVGGDPADGQVYGTAAWSDHEGGNRQPHGILMLRNPAPIAQSITFDPGRVLQPPAGSPHTYAFTERDGRHPQFIGRAGTSATVRLAPFEVAIFEASPSDKAPTPPPEGGNMLPKQDWSATADSQELRGEDGAARNAVDGKLGTIWHTAYTSGIAPLPHELTIDMGKPQRIHRLEYVPRLDGGTNGIISTFEVAVSSDGTTWTTAAAGDFDGSATPQEVDFEPVDARYVRLRATGSANGAQFTSAAEVNLFGRDS